MLREYACTRRELSCIIGNLFTEIEPPCERCGAADVLTISGTTYTGARAVLTVTEHGFTFDGDPAEVEHNLKPVGNIRNTFARLENTKGV